MYVDPSGESFLLILGAILLGGTTGGIAGVFGAAEDEKWYGAFIGGFINGAINTVGLAAALSTGGAVAILWAGGLGFVGGFLGNTASQFISYDDYDPGIAFINGVISGGVNLTLYWGATTYILPGGITFVDALMPSSGVFAAESYLRQFIPNPNKLRTMNYAFPADKHINDLIIDFSWR